MNKKINKKIDTVSEMLKNEDLSKFMVYMEMKGKISGFKTGFIFGGLFVLMILGIMSIF